MRRLSLATLGLAACGSTASTGAVTDAGAEVALVDVGPLPDVAPSLDLATGFRQWEPIEPTGARLELVHGPQGGYHVYARVRITGLVPDVSLSFALHPTDATNALNDTQSLRRRDRMGLVRAGDGYESSTAELVILTQIRTPAEVVGREFALDATVQEYPSGRLLHATRRFTIVDDEP